MIGRFWTCPAGMRVDGPPARGLCRRVASLRSGGDSGSAAEGCGSGCAAIFKVSVTGFTFSVIWHEKHYVDQPPPVAFPPLVPYGTKGGDAFPRPPGRL